jgi:hypothetical protein
MDSPEQVIEVTGLQIAGQRPQPGSQSLEWRIARDMLHEIPIPINILFDCYPPLTEELTFSVMYPKEGGGVAEIETKVKPNAHFVHMDYEPETFGEVWVALMYKGQLYFEDVFAIEPLD